MSVPFMDLARGPRGRDEAIEAAVVSVLRHRRFILGDEVARFEAALGEALDGAKAIGVSSGTDGLLVSLMAMGVGRGSAVLTTPFSFFATAGVVARLGARLVFSDIELETFQLDVGGLPSSGAAELDVVMPVHLFGETADLAGIRRWAGQDVRILEDAAHAIGAREEGGAWAGCGGEAGVFSFFPTKNLGACGDAGAVVTHDPELAARVERLRSHGQSAPYHHEEVGGNFRLDAIQGAALAAGLPWVEEFTAQRRANAEGYLGRLDAAGLLDGRLIPPRRHGRHTYHQFVVRIPERRDEVAEGLRDRGIGCAIYYPTPFHLQPCFAHLGYEPGAFPQAELAAREVLALPVFPGLTPGEQDEVVGGLSALL